MFHNIPLSISLISPSVEFLHGIPRRGRRELKAIIIDGNRCRYNKDKPISKTLNEKLTSLKQQVNSEATCYKMQDMYLMKGGKPSSNKKGL
jgi:hypothetical protein